jgi:predicted Zn finger-like uncharacterized protein
MRLVCPNCDAQYEVDNGAIPDAGRDVQCSNCGHTWFQLPPDLEAEMEADRAIFGAVTEATTQQPTRVAPASPAAIEPEPAEVAPVDPQVVAEVSPFASDPPPPMTPPAAAQRRALDDSLLAVLREEAERETAVRRQETPRPLETQTDLGLEEPTASASAAKAVRDRLARLRGQEPEVEVTDRPAARRDLLPDIEEINSTLRASSENRESGSTTESIVAPVAAAPKSGFRSGLSLMLLLAVLAVFAYVAAPQIAEHIPTLQEPMAQYVTQVDKLRVWVDTQMQNATSGLQDLTGSSEN